MKSVSQFAQTKQLFWSYFPQYVFPISYDTWLASDDDFKAAILFVNFYKEIALAWSKWTAPYFLAEDAVSLAMQYINKQVPRLYANPKLYTPQYFYTVAWNAFGGYIKTHPAARLRSDLEISCLIEQDDNSSEPITMNIADLFPSYDDDLEVVQAKALVWEIIESLGPKAEKVVNHLINPKDSLRKTSHRCSDYAKDRLRDVSVSTKEYEEIMGVLRERLIPYQEFFLS